jgi:hypothetical protein
MSTNGQKRGNAAKLAMGHWLFPRCSKVGQVNLNKQMLYLIANSQADVSLSEYGFRYAGGAPVKWQKWRSLEQHLVSCIRQVYHGCIHRGVNVPLLYSQGEQMVSVKNLCF